MNSTRMYKANVKGKSGSSIDEYLVYEKVSSFGVEYRDMELNVRDRWFYSIDVDEIVSLVPLSRMLELNKMVSIRTVLKRYYEDLRQLLNVKDLYIGDVGIVTNKQPITVSEPGLTIQPFLYNRLLLKDSHFLLDLEDYNAYDYVKSLDIGDTAIANQKPFAKIFQDKIQSVEIQKKKVLEMYHERYQEKR